MKLEQGSKIAVIGGGPAGSMFALYALSYARLAGLKLNIAIYEPKLFSDTGPAGCNRCAGVLSSRFLWNLKTDLGIELPTTIVQSQITSYRLHSPFGMFDIASPERRIPAVTIYRGGGPRLSRFERQVSFDSFLLGAAVEKGAAVIRERVGAMSLKARPTVEVKGQTFEYDLLVLASGVKSSTIQYADSSYVPPSTYIMVVDELFAGNEAVARSLGTTAQIFVFPNSDILFGSLIPKGPFINASLLSTGRVAPNLNEFLNDDLVRKCLPSDYSRSCGCKAMAAVSSAKGPYGDRFVAVGDASVTRLYKDGIGSALLTSRAAAHTAVLVGVAAADFATYYKPTCDKIRRDNWYGHLLFRIHRRSKNSPTFFRTQRKLVIGERTKPASRQTLNHMIWGMFSGGYDYSQILRMGLSPGFLLRLVVNLTQDKIGRWLKRFGGKPASGPTQAESGPGGC